MHHGVGIYPEAGKRIDADHILTELDDLILLTFQTSELLGGKGLVSRNLGALAGGRCSRRAALLRTVSLRRTGLALSDREGDADEAR